MHLSKVGNIPFRLTFNLAADIVSGAVLQPLLDVLANPDIINLLVEIGFSPEPSKSFGKRCGRDVVFLENFVNSHHTPSQSVHNISKQINEWISLVVKVVLTMKYYINLWLLIGSTNGFVGDTEKSVFTLRIYEIPKRGTCSEPATVLLVCG